VLTAWRAEQALARAREVATEVRRALEAGRPIAEVAADFDLEERAIAPRSRTEQAERPAVHAALFAGAPGEAAPEIVEVGGAVGVVMIDDETGHDTEIAGRVRQEIRAGFTRDILTEYEYALRDAHPVRVNRGAIDRYFASEPDT